MYAGFLVLPPSTNKCMFTIVLSQTILSLTNFIEKTIYNEITFQDGYSDTHSVS